MAKISIVCDTGPIIGYARANYIHLFPQLFEVVAIPEGVRDELLRGGDRPGAREARECPWLQTEKAQLSQTFNECYRTLGEGESQAIALAEIKGWPLFLEDGPARKIAVRYVPLIIGSGLLLKMALSQGLIPSARTVLQALADAKYRLGPKIIQEILVQLGEPPL